MAHGHPEHTVRARFGGLEPARRAIAALERAGVPGSDIDLEGPLAEKAAGQQDTSVSDEAFMQVAAKTVFGGAAIGAGIGALLGLLAGLAFLDTTGLAIAIAVASGGAAGGGLGFVVNAMLSMQQADAAELTYHDVENGDGDVYVAVHTPNADDAERATGKLRNTEALQAQQFGADEERAQ